MISEIAIILACLCFLAVSTHRIYRPFAFICAVLVWGAARVLMEISFRNGAHEYSWGSLPSLLAACCLFISVLLIYAACAHKRHPHKPAEEPAQSPAAETDTEDETAACTSDRIRRLLDERPNSQ